MNQHLYAEFKVEEITEEINQMHKGHRIELHPTENSFSEKQIKTLLNFAFLANHYLA